MISQLSSPPWFEAGYPQVISGARSKVAARVLQRNPSPPSPAQMPCRYFHFPHVLRASQRAANVARPRGDGRSVPQLFFIGWLNSQLPIPCCVHRDGLKRKTLVSLRRSELSLRRCLSCSECQARQRLAVAVPRWLSSISKACSVSSSLPKASAPERRHHRRASSIC